MELFTFGFICLFVVGVIAFALAFKERIKDGRKANQNLIAGNLENSDIELSKALDNLQIYNSNTESINISYKTIHFLCKNCKNDVSVNFQFLDLSFITKGTFVIKCPLCGKKVVTGKVKDGVIYFF
jgi:predicted RNA-binding Zn-ribbon protein involved in translation (DUF1610 family)